jgi:hypothetical protein
MPNHKVGDRLQVKLSGGRIVEATIKAIVDTTESVRLQVSFGDETAKIFCGRSSKRLVDRHPPQLLKNGAFDGRREI